MRLIITLLAFLTPYGTHAYIIMFAILLACGFGLPLPEDVVLISGGMLAARGVTDWTVVTLVCMAGVIIGDGIVFGLGRHFGERVKSLPLIKKILHSEREIKVRTLFAKHGDKVIFFARFMPGLRMPIFLSAGIYRVKPWKFVLIDGVAALFSVPAWIWVGHAFGENLEVLEKKIAQLQMGTYTILGLVLLSILGIYFVKKKLMKV